MCEIVGVRLSLFDYSALEGIEGSLMLDVQSPIPSHSSSFTSEPCCLL